MLKCPACGRPGGPFRLRHQIQVDNQIVRNWGCPCGYAFNATAGAERASSAHALYTGFTVEFNGRAHNVALKTVQQHETTWSVGAWTISVSGPSDGPGTRLVALAGNGNEPLGEWRLQPGWGPAEVGRRIKVWPLPSDLSPDLLARVLVRVLS